MLFISGCSVNEPKIPVDNSPAYKFIAISQTDLSKDGDTCADAIGTIRLYKNGIYGAAKDTFNRNFKITGKVNNDKITGGFAISIFTAVDFNGQLDHNKEFANGTWKDIYDCKGYWKASKIKFNKN